MCYRPAAGELHKIMTLTAGSVSCGFSSTSPPKANPGILVTWGGGVTSEKMANRAMIHLSQGVRYHAKGYTALDWNLTSVDNDPLRALGSTPLYLHLPPIWGAVGGKLLDPLYSWATYG
jgi:hypothetical protein